MTSYPSDLSDKEWEILSAYFPAYNGFCRPRIHSIRSIINGIRYVLRSGCQWRMLPKDYPPWKTVYDYYRTWRLDGTWDRVHDALRATVREQAGKNAIPTVAIIDSRSVKTAQKGGSVAITQAKRSKGESSILL
jgi:putative transposase